MTNKFSFKSLSEDARLIYVAPILVIAALLHIFSPIPAQHQFGQMEIFGAFITIGYYLWVHIANVYPAKTMGKKRIEMVVCIVAGIFSALLLFAPLFTWQYIMLYRASNRAAYTKPVLIAIITLWAASLVFFYGSYSFNANRLQQLQQTSLESSMPNTGMPQ